MYLVIATAATAHDCATNYYNDNYYYYYYYYVHHNELNINKHRYHTHGSIVPGFGPCE